MFCLDSWPEAPLLPKDLEEEDGALESSGLQNEELEAAQDEDLEVKAGGTFFWLEDRYEAWEEPLTQRIGAKKGCPRSLRRADAW